MVDICLYVTPRLHNMINVHKGEASVNFSLLVFELAAGCGCAWFYYTSGSSAFICKSCIKVPFLPSDLGARVRLGLSRGGFLRWRSLRERVVKPPHQALR